MTESVMPYNQKHEKKISDLSSELGWKMKSYRQKWIKKRKQGGRYFLSLVTLSLCARLFKLGLLNCSNAHEKVDFFHRFHALNKEVCWPRLIDELYSGLSRLASQKFTWSSATLIHAEIQDGSIKNKLQNANIMNNFLVSWYLNNWGASCFSLDSFPKSYNLEDKPQ